MPAPLFTVVIPTKDRPGYVGQSIASVLKQSFTDLECIVSDNFNDEKTYAAIQPFLVDKRLKYLRTSRNMNMLDHWEWATKQATGTYVFVLADRKLLYKNALSIAARAIARNPDINVFSVGVRIYDDIVNQMGWSPPARKSGIYSTRELISNFLNADYLNAYSTLDRLFPKTINGFYKNSFAEKVREIYGSYFNEKGVTTPDYSSFFINCALNSKCYHISFPSILSQGEQSSNGRIFSRGNYKSYMDFLGLAEPFSKVPIKAPFIYNLLLSDFIHIRESYGGNLVKFSVNWSNYLYNCLREYHLFKDKSPLFDEETKSWFLEMWEQAAQQLTDEGKLAAGEVEEIKQKVFASLEAAPQPKDVTYFRSHFRDFVVHNFGRLNLVNSIFPHRFQNALQAAGHGSVLQ